MTLSELRIGNFIQWGVHDCKVKSFTRPDIDEEIWIYTDKTIGAIDISEFKPIELTPDWLDRAGFQEFDDDGGYEFKEDIAIQLNHEYLSDSGYDFIFDTQFLTSIKSVHQLQNIYFALTGKELDFKPGTGI